jgi:hypothetical protein
MDPENKEWRALMQYVRGTRADDLDLMEEAPISTRFESQFALGTHVTMDTVLFIYLTMNGRVGSELEFVLGKCCHEFRDVVIWLSRKHGRE